MWYLDSVDDSWATENNDLDNGPSPHFSSKEVDYRLALSPRKSDGRIVLMRMGEVIRSDDAIQQLYDHIVSFNELGGRSTLFPPQHDLEMGP